MAPPPGGAAPGLKNPTLRLLRGADAYAIPLQELLASPARDLSLRGGDRLVLEEDRRSFLALGASGVQAQIAFSRAEMSALEGVTQMGGLTPGRADPKGVLVLRDYGPGQVRSDGRGPDRSQVVFALDLTSAEGLFAARSFALADRDLLYATESPVTNTRTIFSLAGQLFGLANRLE